MVVLMSASRYPVSRQNSIRPKTELCLSVKSGVMQMRIRGMKLVGEFRVAAYLHDREGTASDE